jgi:hypothetical protein
MRPAMSEKRTYVLAVRWNDGWHLRSSYPTFERAMWNAAVITVPVRIDRYAGQRFIETVWAS